MLTDTFVFHSSSSELLFTFDNHTSSITTPLASSANIDNYTNSSPLNNTINLTHDSNISPLVRNSSHSSTDIDSASVSGSDTDNDELTDISFDVTQPEDNTSDNSLSSNLFEQINKSCLNIYYANVDSVLNKREELQVIVDNKDPDMIVLTEVYPKNVKPDDISQAELEINGYDRIHEEITDSCRGVCIYYKSDLAVTECRGFINHKFQESCWCVVTLETKEKLLLGVVYHSPNSIDANTNKLFTLIQEAINLKFDYTMILGDFNFPTIDWENWSAPHSVTHPEFKFIECLRDKFLSQLITIN